MQFHVGFRGCRYVAYVPGMAGNLADRGGLSYLEPTKPQSILIKSAQTSVPTCSLIRVSKIRLGMLPMCLGWQGTLQIGGDFRT